MPNLPTLLIALALLAVFGAIVGKGIWNKKHGKGGCACGGDCSRCKGCH